MLTLTSPVETPFHRLPAGAKLGALCLFTALLFHLNSPLPLAALLAALTALHLTQGGTFAAHALRLLRPLWPFALVIALWHLWQRDLAGGATILLRLLAAVMAANLVTMTTRLSDMLALTERLATPLRHIGLAPRAFALAIALTVRFLPVLSQRVAEITDAFRARSPRRPGHRILIPATLAALDDADRVAEALRARGGAG